MANLTAVIGADTSKFVEEVKAAQYMLNKFVDETKSATDSVKRNTSVTNEQVTSYQRVLKALDKVASGTMTTQQQQKALADQIKELKIQWNGLSDAAKSSEFGHTLADTMRAAQDELKLLGEQVKAANADLSQFGNVNPKGSLKKELKLLTNELTTLTAQYRAMSAVEKQSAQGRELAAKMDELREKAGTLTDTIGDVNSEIRVLASDTPNLDVFNDLLGISADAMSTYSSVIAKVTGNEKALKDAIATVMTVQSAANLATKVTNALQSSSAIMLKTRAIQEGAAAVAIKIRAAAEGKGTAATKAATAAQAAFNLVAKANPYVLLASALLGVVSAFALFSKGANDAADNQSDLNKELENGKQKAQEYSSITQTTYANLMTSYTKLKNSWNQLRTAHEKNKWIKDNANELNNLELEIVDVDSAEKIFNGNTDTVVQSFIARAKAAARLAEMVDEYRKQMKLIDEIGEIETAIKLDASKMGRSAKSGDEIKDASYHNKRYGSVNNEGKWVFHDQGAKLYSGTDVSTNPQVKAKQAELNASVAKTDKIAAEMAADASKVKKIVSTSSNKGAAKDTKVTETPLTGTLEALKVEQSKIQQELTKGQIKPDDIYDKETNQIVAQRLAELPDLIESKEIELGLRVDPKIKEQETARKKLQAEIDKLLKETNEIEFTPDFSSFDKAIGNDSFDTTTLSGIESQMNFNDSLISQLETLKQKYEELGQTGSDAYSNVCNKIKETKDAQDDLGESAKVLQERQEQEEKEIENLEKLAQSYHIVSSAVSDLGSAFSNLGAISDNVQLQAAGIIANAIATMIQSYTTAAAQASKMGPWVWAGFAMTGLAQVTAVVSQLKTIGKFANGGIINGSTTIGDYNLARVNSGEMILNGRQQTNLFNAIDQNRLGGGNTIVGGEIKIKGSDLYVALKNYGKVQGALGKNIGIK